MSTKLRRFLIKFISAAICLLLLFANSNVIVLCIGQDGHVEIETAASDCCTDNHSNETAKVIENLGQSFKNNDCGSCVDIPISCGLFGKLDQLKNTIPTSFATATISPSNNNSSDFCNSRIITTSLTQSTYFIPLSTIILLT
ncbi:MAG: hypothetical protein ACYSWP_14235 [Planctomycetota bacterium]|jgi:hypothetical protein